MKWASWAFALLTLCGTPSLAGSKDDAYQGPRELRIGTTIENYDLSNRQLARLPVVRDAFIENMAEVGSSTLVNGAVYTTGQVITVIPVVGGMVKDGIDKLHQEFGNGMRDEYTKLFDAALKKVIYSDSPADYSSLKDRLFPNTGTGTVDMAAADAFVSSLIGTLNRDYDSMPSNVKLEVQRQAIEYLAHNFDRLQGVTSEAVAELNRQRSRTSKLSASFMRVEKRIQRLDALQAVAVSEVQQEGDSAAVAVTTGDSKNAQLSQRQMLADFSGQAAIARDQLDAFSSGLNAFGLHKEAVVVAKAAKACSFLASAAQVAAGNYFAVLPAFSALGGLFGSSDPDPVQLAIQQVLEKLEQIERKIDAYHKEDLARFTGIETQLNEVIRIDKFIAIGDAPKCRPWISSEDRLASAISADNLPLRISGAVYNFSSFYDLKLKGLEHVFAGDIAKRCLTGLSDILVSDPTNPGLFLDAVDITAFPGGGKTVPTDKRVSYYWDRTRKASQQLLKPDAMNPYFSTPGFGGSPAGSGKFTDLGIQYFSKDNQIYNLGNLIKYSSYAAALHGVIAFYDRAGGAIKDRPNQSRDGELLIANSLAHIESSIAQLRLLSEGPLLQLVFNFAAGDLVSFSATNECKSLVIDCSAIATASNKKYLEDLVNDSPWLAHNLGVLLIRKALADSDASSYRFVVSYAAALKSPLLIKHFFKLPLPAGYDVIYDDQDSSFYLQMSNSRTRLPLADELESHEFAYPIAMLESIRVEQQLIMELAGYRLKREYTDRAAVTMFAKAGILMPD